MGDDWGDLKDYKGIPMATRRHLTNYRCIGFYKTFETHRLKLLGNLQMPGKSFEFFLFSKWQQEIVKPERPGRALEARERSGTSARMRSS